MAAMRGARAKFIFLFLFISNNVMCGQYKIPEVNIEILTQGLRVSIPDEPNVTLFVFQGNVNRDIEENGVGSISGEVSSPTAGRWSFEDRTVTLKKGDVIKYYVHIVHDSKGYVGGNMTYTVGESKSIDQRTTPTYTTSTCLPTVSKIRGSAIQVCSGQTLFEDDFVSLNENIWQIEQKLPNNHPEYPFVSYQRLQSTPTVSVEGGNLKIKPQLQQNLPGFSNDSIYSGTLDLYDSCTESDACFMTAFGSNILPPIVSGRISTKNFSFKYGHIEMRAKLPQGDWLYPELLLEPFIHRYGRENFASGVIKIASARGNKELYVGPSKYDNKVLYGGPIMDYKCRDTFLNSKINKENWGSEFHKYSLRWEPDLLRFYVDDVEWARVEAGGGLRDQITRQQCPHAPHMLWARGQALAPFDQDFYLTLGVAAGGIGDFRDGLYTEGGRPKPWTNLSSKSKLHFWHDLTHWHRTWDSDSALLVDSVKITAL